MLTVCLSDRVMENQNKAKCDTTMHSINDALISMTISLKSTDFICFNIGNKMQVLRNDLQQNLEYWKQVKNRYDYKISGRT